MDKSVPVKMVIIIFRESLEDEIVSLLKQVGVQAFTELHHVEGLGETGAAFHSFTWPGSNAMILTALPDDHADRLVKRLREFHDQRVQHQHGLKFPLRVFVLPCLESV